MAKQQKAWMPKPAKTSKTSIPDAVKSDLETKAANLIENVLKSKHVVPQKPDIEFNYMCLTSERNGTGSTSISFRHSLAPAQMRYRRRLNRSLRGWNTLMLEGFHFHSIATLTNGSSCTLLKQSMNVSERLRKMHGSPRDLWKRKFVLGSVMPMILTLLLLALAAFCVFEFSPPFTILGISQSVKRESTLDSPHVFFSHQLASCIQPVGFAHLETSD